MARNSFHDRDYDFKASIVYEPRTLRQMCNVQIRSRLLHNVIYLIMCAVLILAGMFFGASTIHGLLCIAAGAVSIPLLGSVVRTRTENIINALHGHTLQVFYHFDQSGISTTVGEKKSFHQYSALTGLWEDTEYCYLFYGRIEAFMLAKKTLSPEDVEAFREDLEITTGLKWKQYTPLLSFQIKPLFREVLSFQKIFFQRKRNYKG